jgi:hypothetical protein
MSDEILTYDPWPALSAEEFKPSSHLLYMCVQVIGKLMLYQAFKPHWANLAMPLTSRGLTTGMIPYQRATFSVDIDCIDHVIIFTSSWGATATLKLSSMSVAELTHAIFQKLESIGVKLKINQQSQEMSKPVLFNEDKEPRVYDGKIVNAWWRILLSTSCVLEEFHSRFYGITPQIGVCWGTLDLRDARYKGIFLPQNTADFITRNAMDDEQFEVGFSANNEKYPVPSFFAFAYPKPEGFEKSILKVSAAKWVPAINEFILDYDDLRKSKNPEKDLLEFFESSYQAFATLAKWDPKLIVSGKPI